MADRRLEPQPEPTAPAAAPPEEEFHCPNCLFLGDPTAPETGFWACQNLCIRE
ncbi:MAG TPA: hypothetical protein V6D47_19885 [Oscillatoriaceae cyanobacterium]